MSGSEPRANDRGDGSSEEDVLEGGGAGDGERERRLTLSDESDVVVARRHARELGQQCGLNPVAIEAVATAVTEIARNVVVHAGSGQIGLHVARGVRAGALRWFVHIVVTDVGPGIPDVQAALVDGFSTGEGLGIGLPSARRLMDAFELTTAVGQGTTVTLEKWAQPLRTHV